jgi:DNA-binding NtrC family response regulator
MPGADLVGTPVDEPPETLAAGPVAATGGELRDFTHVSSEVSAHRVLVVDDEPLIRWSLRQTLADHGFRVDEAEDAAGAIHAASAESCPFDLVLLDFRLPDSNDLGLLTTLKRLMPRTPIVLMTAFGTPEVVQHALDLGALRVIIKPFEMNEIASLVERTLSGH